MIGKRDYENTLSALRPLTIFALMPMYVTILLLGQERIYWILLGFSFFLLLFTNKKKVASKGVTYFLLYVMARLASDFFEVSHWIGTIYTMMLIMLKLYPLWILSYIMTCYNTSEIINSLRKLRIPNHFCIGAAMFFRFVPEFLSYLKTIHEGVKVRGLKFRFYRPVESFELYVVPMIFKAIETGEILTCALLTKGIQYDCKKSSFRDLSFRIYDTLAIGFVLCLTVVTVWMKY